jgi:hypothetical protein
MSQAGSLTGGGSVLPDVETLTGDSGGAVGPDAAFNIDILGGTGITTVGVPGSNSITINNDTQIEGTAQTVGAVTADVITFALGGTAGVYVFEGRVAGFNTTDTAGGGYFVVGAVRTTGAAGVEIASEVTDDLEEANMAAADIAFVVAGNDVILRVTGIAAKTIEWSAEMEYRSVS